jgi:hypothetical protein
MAKVTGPLFSLDASGGFGGSLVFGKWKGRNTVRQLVIPSNPQSQIQQDARNEIRVVGTSQHWANYTTEKGDSRLNTDKEALIALAPAGQAWNGFLSKSMIGAGGLNYTAASAAWTALTSLEKGAWDTAADALTPAFPATYQADAFGVAGTPVTSGEGFFHYQYGLYVAGVAASLPDATPPTYA